MSDRLLDDQVIKTISSIVAEALLIDPAKIKNESRLFYDLGAESIDILDIRFRIESAFGIKINQQELIDSLGDGLEADQIRQKFTVGSLVHYVKGVLNQKNEA